MAQETPEQSDKDSLKDAIASSTGVSDSNIHNFAVTSTAARRRLSSSSSSSENSSSDEVSSQEKSSQGMSPRSKKVQRLLPTSYIWAVSFEIVVSLAETTSASPTAFAASVVSGLNSGNFTDSLTAAMGATFQSMAVTPSVELLTRAPSSKPSSSPTPEPISYPTRRPSPRPSSLSHNADMHADPTVSLDALTVALITLGCVAGALCILFALLKAKQLKERSTKVCYRVFLSLLSCNTYVTCCCLSLSLSLSVLLYLSLIFRFFFLSLSSFSLMFLLLSFASL